MAKPFKYTGEVRKEFYPKCGKPAKLRQIKIEGEGISLADVVCGVVFPPYLLGCLLDSGSTAYVCSRCHNAVQL